MRTMYLTNAPAIPYLELFFTWVNPGKSTREARFEHSQAYVCSLLGVDHQFGIRGRF